MGKAWDGVLSAPVEGRMAKPRNSGWTMVIDKGLGLAATEDLLDLAGDYIDLLKLSFGTSAFYPAEMLREKTAMVKAHRVGIMPGGTFAEVALLQGRWDAYLERAAQLGFDTLEISDGTITLAHDRRLAAILSARDKGFRVVTEVGKKHPGDQPSLESQIETAISDLKAGAAMVIIEGRESGSGVGIFGVDGEIVEDRLTALAERLPLSHVIWEAPRKNQQEELILSYGPNVNLGNIPPSDILALEALRIGLRGDTLRAAIQAGTGAPLPITA